MGKRWIEQPKCAECGLFVVWGADNETPFGTKDYENPEPLDPEYYCDKHARLYYKKLLEAYSNGSRWGAYIKSKAEIRAAQEAGLEWVHSTGYVDTRAEKDVHYTYILKSEKEYYEPYLEWHAEHPRHDFWLPESDKCRRCGVDWKTGHTQGTEYCHQVKTPLRSTIGG